MSLVFAFNATEAVSQDPVPEPPAQSSIQPDRDLLDFPLGGMEVVTPFETHSFVVELALDQPHQAQGLMFRKHLPDDQGMLFMFPKDGMRSFWMRNTLIPLDIIFINSQGVIVHVHPNAKPLDESPIPSRLPAKAVLELRGGLAEELSINVGDRIQNLRQFGVKPQTQQAQKPRQAAPKQPAKPNQTRKTKKNTQKTTQKAKEKPLSYWESFLSWF
ncbi:MAG: DUF192 domain-containing protein [Alphaproteobacteria bacterium]